MRIDPVYVVSGFFLIFCFVSAVYNTFKHDAKSTQEKILDFELKNITNEDDAIRLYEKSKLTNKKIDVDLLETIVEKLIKMKAFPEGVLEWLVYPSDYSEDALMDVMDEFIAMRQGKLKDDIAVNAYLDGFISIDEALTCIDKTKYPQTIDALKSDMEDIRIRKILQKEKTKL